MNKKTFSRLLYVYIGKKMILLKNNKLVLSENDLSEHECTILFYALAYNISTIFEVTDDDIIGLSNMLSINSSLLQIALCKNLNGIHMVQVGSITVFMSEIYELDMSACSHKKLIIEMQDYNIFYMFFEIYQCYKYLNEVSFCTTINELRNNLSNLDFIENFFVNLNAVSGCYENHKLPEFLFDYKYCMYDEVGSSQINLIRHLKSLLLIKGSSLNMDYCNTVCKIITYELNNRITTIRACSHKTIEKI